MHSSTQSSTHRSSTHRSSTHRSARKVLALLAGVLLAGAMLAVGGTAQPASAAPVLQCNGVGGGGGQGYDCSVTITNTFDVSTGLGSSTVRTVLCNGAANTTFGAGDCVDSGILPFAELTPSVNQCNGTVGGNGGSLYCSVTMTNTIIGAATTGIATVNQCIGSLGGGGIVPGSGCDPVQETTGATVTQCNGSVNGGGGFMQCTVGASTTNTGFDVDITQCNGSAEGTGNLMVCSASITTIVLPADDGSGDGDGDGGNGAGGDGAGGDDDAGTLGLDELAATGMHDVAASAGFAAVIVVLLGATLAVTARRVARR